MAILMRGGLYNDFDPSKLKPREWAVVLGNDPGSADGRTVYLCFGSGVVKRIATHEDMVDIIKNATEDIQEEFQDMFDEILAQMQALKNQTEGYRNVAIEKAAEATSAATSAQSSANAAASAAQSISSSAQTATQKATEASQSAASAATSASQAGESAAAAEAARQDAENSKTAAGISETNAAGSAASALESAQAAEASKENAAASQAAAAGSAGEAATSAEEAAASALSAAGSAETAIQYSGKPPRPKNGTWWTWDATDGEYKNTGIKSVLSIVKSYPSIVDMELDAPNMEEGDLVIIASDVEEEDNSKLFVHNGTGWTYLSDLSGLQGVGIANIEKTSGTGLAGSTDVYTITLTDGRTSTFTVYNGRNGEGVGDMEKSVYDPQGKQQDIFQYVDDGLAEKADLVNGKVPDNQLPSLDYIPTDEKGASGGVAELDESGKVPDSQLPELNYEPAGSVEEHNESPTAHPLIRQAITALGAVVAGKGDSLEYDEEEEELHLKSGEQIISTVKIAGGSGGGGVALPPPTDISLTNADGEVVVKWTDPEDIAVNGATIATWAGTLVVRKVGSPPTSRTDGVVVIDSKTRNAYQETGFSDTGLTNGTEYFYGIFPYTTGKAYTYEATENITPEAIYPSAPTGVSVSAGDEEMVVQFGKPGDATEVKIAYSQQQPESNTEPYGTVISNVESPYTITNALNDTAYYLTVYSVNAKGRMTASDMLTATPAAIYPDPPSNVSVKAGDGTITVSFALPENATGAKISYSTQSPESNEVPYGTTITNAESPYVIAGLENDMEYYVTVYSTNAKGRDAAGELLSVTPKSAILFGFIINQNESDPGSMITYIEDNENFTPAHMDYTNDVFNYGSWTVENGAWFMDVKPCMLGYDGEVKQLLDPNDYTKKLDGTPSDVENANFPGNAMVGIPKVYWKIVDNGDDTANIYFCNRKLDGDFVCWSHIDNNGNEIDYCYMPIYSGGLISGKLRSLSGKTPMTNQTAQNGINYAKANNLSNDTIWYTEVFSDRMLINLLLLLIGKSTDTQTVFGTGNNAGQQAGVKSSGTMNQKGLFWGNQDNVSGVKVFGIEHFWGNLWRRIAGWINASGVQKVKMTYGKGDGSTVNGYNLDGSGYVAIPGATPSGTSGGYISSVKITPFGLVPYVSSGSATTHYCDRLWFNNSTTTYAIVGGGPEDGMGAGAFCLLLNSTLALLHWSVGASLSCKPLA